MLVLSRKVGERIWIGDQVSVTIVRIHGGAVRLGIDAPPHMSIVRHELQERHGEPKAFDNQIRIDEPQTDQTLIDQSCLVAQAPSTGPTATA